MCAGHCCTYTLLRCLKVKCQKQVGLWCCRPFGKAQFNCWTMLVSTRDTLVGLFDDVTISVHGTLYLRCLYSD